MGYHSNVPMAIVNTDYEEVGVAMEDIRYPQAQTIREVARGKESAGLWCPTTARLMLEWSQSTNVINI